MVLSGEPVAKGSSGAEYIEFLEKDLRSTAVHYVLLLNILKAKITTNEGIL